MVRKDAQTHYSPSPSVRYQRLSQDDDGFVDAQFKVRPRPIPWKAIGYAGLLLTVGTLLLVVGSLLVMGYVEERYTDRTWPVIILGCLMFIPGAYHSYVAYYAFQGCDGYSFDDIPSYDDD